MISQRAPVSGDVAEVMRLEHENARLRKALSLRNHLEELVLANARLRNALHQYGRHTHPKCHQMTPGESVHVTIQTPCLCGLDEALKEKTDV